MKFFNLFSKFIHFHRESAFILPLLFKFDQMCLVFSYQKFLDSKQLIGVTFYLLGSSLPWLIGNHSYQFLIFKESQDVIALNFD